MEPILARFFFGMTLADAGVRYKYARRPEFYSLNGSTVATVGIIPIVIGLLASSVQPQNATTTLFFWGGIVFGTILILYGFGSALVARLKG